MLTHHQVRNQRSEDADVVTEAADVVTEAADVVATETPKKRPMTPSLLGDLNSSLLT